jgi:hypothetical protein
MALAETGMTAGVLPIFSHELAHFSINAADGRKG